MAGWAARVRVPPVKHPERFVKTTPQPPALPEAVWINPPKLLGGSPDSDPALHRSPLSRSLSRLTVSIVLVIASGLGRVVDDWLKPFDERSGFCGSQPP